MSDLKIVILCLWIELGIQWKEEKIYKLKEKIKFIMYERYYGWSPQLRYMFSD